MRFSERLGVAPPPKLVQRESLDSELRNTLWSLLSASYWNTFSGTDAYGYPTHGVIKNSNFESFLTILWLNFFKQPIDKIDKYWDDCLNKIRTYFFKAQWYEVYDFIEFVANNLYPREREKFTSVCNKYLELENSAYRFVNGYITEVTSAEEIEEVESAFDSASKFNGVSIHLTRALSLLSDKQNPDYRNSIKESISAVESLVRQLAPEDGTINSVLKRFEKENKLHPALSQAFKSLYGYTSDAQGIRHALMDEPHLTKADARFMLVCCSAFINYSTVVLNSA